MKKIISFIVFSFLAVTMASAQGNVKFGLTGGLINTDANVDFSILGFDLGSVDAINETGFYIGGFVDVELTEKFHVQPEVLYGSAGDLGFVYVPVMMKYYIIPKLNIQLGPQLNYSSNLGEIKDGIRTIVEQLDSDANIDDVLRTTSVELAFGAAFDISDQFYAQVRYAIDLSDRYNGPVGASLDVKPKTLFIGVGYSF